MKEITYEELRDIQLGILLDVHNYCIKNDIKYSLAYGTLLGAVRHGGYIPWDDDIDIAMLRDDYERFLKDYNENSTVYKFREARNTNNMNIGFGKVEDTRTVLVESGNTVNIGINIDVFPIDNMHDSIKKSQKRLRLLNIYKFFIVSKVRPLKVVHGITKRLLIAILKCLLMPFPTHEIVIQFIKSVKQNRNNKSIYVAMVLGSSFSMNNIVNRKIWTAFAPISFEGHSFMAVKDTAAYLKHAYGDYMKRPPKEQQVPKHDFESIYWKE